jgi:hypothetical protein
LKTTVTDKFFSYAFVAIDVAFFLDSLHADEPIEFAKERGWVLN